MTAAQRLIELAVHVVTDDDAMPLRFPAIATLPNA